MNELNTAILRVIEQAVQSTSEGITISNAREPDNPLIYAKAAFYQLTGYSLEETIGSNCRFLQGADTDPNAVLEIRQALASGADHVSAHGNSLATYPTHALRKNAVKRY